MTWERAVIVLAMSVLMCAVSGFFAVKKVRTADPADLF
jgi:putative ABC transport system permease protein